MPALVVEVSELPLSCYESTAGVVDNSFIITAKLIVAVIKLLNCGLTFQISSSSISSSVLILCKIIYYPYEATAILAAVMLITAVKLIAVAVLIVAVELIAAVVELMAAAAVVLVPAVALFAAMELAE